MPRQPADCVPCDVVTYSLRRVGKQTTRSGHGVQRDLKSTVCQGVHVLGQARDRCLETGVRESSSELALLARSSHRDSHTDSARRRNAACQFDYSCACVCVCVICSGMLRRRHGSGPEGASAGFGELPFPRDDGQAALLEGAHMPHVLLACTRGQPVDLAALPGVAVILCYSSSRAAEGVAHSQLTCRPYDRASGAGGAVAHLQAFDDAHAALRSAGAAHVYGVAAEPPEWQTDIVTSMRLAFPLLSDSRLQLGQQAQLPVVQNAGHAQLKEAVLVVCRGLIEKVFYPLVPPEQSAARVLQWLQHCN